MTTTRRGPRSSGRSSASSTGRWTGSTRWRAATSRPGCWWSRQDGSAQELSFDALARRSDQLANWLRAQGVGRGDRILLMLGNQIELWETMLAAMKLGAVIIPATTLLAEADLRDRIDRGNARHVVVRSADAAKFDGVPGDYSRIAVGDAVDGWLPYADAYQAPDQFAPDGATNATRHAAAVLHVRHDRAAEARRAHACVVSGRPPDDDVLARPEARRRAPEPVLARLGQARVEQLLRALAGRGDGRDLQLRALRRRAHCWT